MDYDRLLVRFLSLKAKRTMKIYNPFKIIPRLSHTNRLKTAIGNLDSLVTVLTEF